MDCCKLLLFFCLFHLNIVNGAPADPPSEEDHYIVRDNKLYVKNNGAYGLRNPVGCLCPTTGLFGKTGFEKQCTKAYDSSGKRIKYIKMGDGACHVGKQEFFKCVPWGSEMKVQGCCTKADNVYFPPSSVNKYSYALEPNVHKIVTCIPTETVTYEFKMYPQKDGKDISQEPLLDGVTHVNKHPTSPVQGRTRYGGDSSPSGSYDSD